MHNLSLKIYNANRANVRYVIHQGGTGSGKTYTIIYYLLIYALNHPRTSDHPTNISIVAESLPVLKRGAIKYIKHLIITEGMSAVWKENKTDHTWTHTNGAVIECFPADDSAKLRGSRRDMLFINECNNVTWDAYEQLEMRTNTKIILDFNPVARFWVHDKLMPLVPAEQFTYIISTYLDNLAHLPQAVIDSIERMKSNPNKWKVYGLGEIGTLEGLVFSNWDITGDDMPGALLGYGIDFGFVNSPTVIVQVNECGGELYIKELVYKTGMGNEDIYAVAVKHCNLNERAIADSAEPKTIDFLFKKGWKGLKPSIKGPDSIEHGLNILLDKKIHVTRGSVNVIKEFRNYMWDTDKAGAKLNRPIKEWDHGIDAIRYLVSANRKRTLAVA